MCRKRERHCGAYIALQRHALDEWERAETLEAVRAAWGRFGGLVTLHRYGRQHFTALALRRWGRLRPEDLDLLRPRVVR